METVRALDGRELAVETIGHPQGEPVFLLHGTPGSRRGPRPRGIVLHRLGIKLVSYDRPGYGDSTEHPGRNVADAARDVEAIADHYRFDEFCVVGRSGGGPHALACAALLKGRVKKLAALVSVAPVDAKDLDWFDGMGDSNLDEYARLNDALAFEDQMTAEALRIRDDPEALLKKLAMDLGPLDSRVVNDRAVRRQLTETYALAFREGARGWIDDVLAFRRPWGFELGKIEAPALLWHGSLDRFSPIAHTEWLARQIPHAVKILESRASHFTAVEVLPRVLRWLTEPADHESAWPQPTAAAARA